MQFLGVPLQGEDLEFPLHPSDWEELRAIEGAADLPRDDYICIHPGARAATRCWPPESFAAVADALAATGLRMVLTGTAGEKSLTQAVANAMTRPALDLAGQTTLGVLAALLHGSRLLVCNDTGVSHLAAALRVPSVVIFHGMSECEGWPPQDRVRHRIVTSVTGVAPEAVLAQVEDLLRATGPIRAGCRKRRSLQRARA
jgi:ADP-heptose:LPS heptosyltransferase